ncbi:response regulator transcription factor [Paracoccus sp. MBLB3053]|uniref:Response regulator transcription factor n=1 Tax=Paracoccus aurantius TaxID=3073814 RepID=A0ABU2HRK9_9RHOB|nr:response regulator transcription factor [Paracoccus sp. MBLB3053]MDS9467688.1 response regulator transcription factor [Paracoccus sp. MBLB3053]
MSTDDREFIKGVADLSLGLAFTTWEFGIASHADPLFRSSRASLFPLNVRLDVWLSVVRLIAHGGNYVCPEVISTIKAEDHSPLAGDGSLTRRQMDVLRLVADGQSNKLIAETLGLSIHTVKLHLHNGSARLGARNRTEAALRYREMYR